MVTYATISPKMVNPRDIAGNAEEDELSLQLVVWNHKDLLTYLLAELQQQTSLPLRLRQTAKICLVSPVFSVKIQTHK